MTRRETLHRSFHGEARLSAALYTEGPAETCTQKVFYYKKQFMNLESLNYYQNIDFFKYYAFRHFTSVFE